MRSALIESLKVVVTEEVVLVSVVLLLLLLLLLLLGLGLTPLLGLTRGLTLEF